MKIERVIVKLPDGFDPARHMKALNASISERYGDGFEVDSIDVESQKAYATRQGQVAEVSVGKTSITVHLPKGTKTGDGERIAARMAEQNPGYQMVSFEPHVGRATLSKMDDRTIRARAAVAVVLGVKPWDIKIAPRNDDGFDLVLPQSYLPSKHDEKLDEVATTIVGRLGWYVDADPQTLRASILPGDPPTFKVLEPYPFSHGDGRLVLEKDKWSHIPLGRVLGPPGGDDGPELLTDMVLAPHMQISGLTGAGKLLKLDTRVPVPVSDRFPNGWATVETLSVGDDVYAADGTPTKIVGFSDVVEQDVYKVAFSTGQVVECGPDHLWSVANHIGRVSDTPYQRSKHKNSRSRYDAHVEKLSALAHAAHPGTFATSEVIAKLSGASSGHVLRVMEMVGIPREMVPTDFGHTRFVNKYALESVLLCAEKSRWSVLRSILDVDNPFGCLPSWATARELMTACGVENPSRDQIHSFKASLLSLGAEMKSVFEHVQAIRSVASFPVGEALWALSKHMDDVAREKAPLEQIRTTVEMFESQKYLDGRPNWSVRVGGALQGAAAALPLDPYILGIWLGDGNTSGGQLTQGVSVVCTDKDGLTDQEFMLDQLRLAGIDASQSASIMKRINTRGLRVKLHESGVLGRKHIPTTYLRASESQRLALLQGLMDTDGTIDASGGCELCLCDETLVHDSLELIRSLGIKASITSSDASIAEVDPDDPSQKRRRVTGTRWRIHFTTDKPVFRLPRKLARVKNVMRKTQDWLYITDIKKSGRAKMRCLRVAHPSHLVLVDEFVPTHNSVVLETLMTGALANGWELCIIDAVKGGIDFIEWQPFVRDDGWGDDLPSACCVITLVYKEGLRRKKIVQKHGVQKWTQLPASEGIKPLMLMVDELTSLIMPEPSPKGVPKDNPLAMEVAERNLMKATILNNLGKIARELRFAGISLVASTQVASTTTGVPTELRANLGAKLLLGSKPTDNNRRLALNDPDAVPRVPLNIVDSPNGESRGVGVYEFEGQKPGIVKTYFATPKEYGAWLAKLPVHRSKNPRPSSATITMNTPSLESDDDGGGGDAPWRSPEVKPQPPVTDPETGEVLKGYDRANEVRRRLEAAAKPID